MKYLTGAALFGGGLFIGLFGSAFILNFPHGSSDWAAWAQAVGSGLAVTAAFVFPWRQAKRDTEIRRLEKRTRVLFQANTLRVIALESSEAVGNVRSVMDRQSTFAVTRYDATIADFNTTADDLFVRIAALTQTEGMLDEALSQLFEIRQILRDIRTRFSAIRDAQSLLDQKQRREIDMLQERLLIISAAIFMSHDSLERARDDPR